MNKIKVLHISIDDKFFDVIYDFFEDDNRYENSNIILSDDETLKLNYVKTEKAVPVCKKDDIIDYLETSEYDAVYFHSLPPKLWWMIDYIPQDKIIIWWAWGYDIYDSYKGFGPLLEVEMYKPITAQIVRERMMRYRRNFLRPYYEKYILGPLIKRKSRRVLSRIDYFQPILSVEYDMMKALYPEMKAQRFASNEGIPEEVIFTEDCSKSDKILIGNSATFTNNHIDIIDFLKSRSIDDSRFLIPLNYGSDRDILVEKIKEITPNSELILDFLPREVYYKRINSLKYALFGVMRQQAMGNIYQLLCHGVKLFFYKESIPYKYFSQRGYIVFAIEDISNDSFSEPLSNEQASHNASLFIKDQKERLALYNNATDEIMNRISIKS